MPSHKGICVNPECPREGKISCIISRGLCATCYSRLKVGTLVMPERKPIIKVCAYSQCGKTFEVESLKPPRKYCCDDCKRLAQNEHDRAANAARRNGETLPSRMPPPPQYRDNTPWGLDHDPWAAGEIRPCCPSEGLPLSTLLTPFDCGWIAERVVVLAAETREVGE